MANPLTPFLPTREALLDCKAEKGVGTIDAKTHLTRANMAAACEAATTLDELRVVVRALVSLARFH